MLAPGTPAPPFRLPDQDGKSVALHELRGRWTVLYFYPKDDTPGCTIEACEFTAALPSFRGLDAEVFGCSADGATAHQRFIAKHRLGIRLLTDVDRAVMKQYGAWGRKVLYGKEVEGVIRSTVLIAPDGTIAHHWPTVRAEGHAEQVRAKLAELQGAGGGVVSRAQPGKTKRAVARTPTALPAKGSGKAAPRIGRSQPGRAKIRRKAPVRPARPAAAKAASKSARKAK